MTTQGATWEAQLCRGLRYVKLDDPQMSDLNIEDIYIYEKHTEYFKQFPEWILGSGSVEQCIGLSLGAQVSHGFPEMVFSILLRIWLWNLYLDFRFPFFVMCLG